MTIAKGIQTRYIPSLFGDISHLMNTLNVKINLTKVFTDLINSLRDAWTARKDLYTTAAMYYTKAYMQQNQKIKNPNREIVEEDLGEFIEEEFIKLRRNIEAICYNMSRTPLNESYMQSEDFPSIMMTCPATNSGYLKTSEISDNKPDPIKTLPAIVK
uniref:Uncharacterized protein n=1 Tax=Trichobilharzia regenti TaxID=157069 RepID=A0AA85IX11_TRIRE|nr:unnamed protein product [Trichobilharzia regenti]